MFASNLLEHLAGSELEETLREVRRGLRPREQIWVGPKAPWVEIADDLPRFPEGPPPS